MTSRPMPGDAEAIELVACPWCHRAKGLGCVGADSRPHAPHGARLVELGRLLKDRERLERWNRSVQGR